MTVAAQIRQAARHLGYAADDWRVREAWYGRSGAWSAAAVGDLRQRFAKRREQDARSSAATDPDRVALVQRLDTIRAGLAEVTRQVNELEAEIRRSA